MAFSTSINLLSSSGGLAVSGHVPYRVRIFPHTFELPNKLIKLCYLWGDNTKQEVTLFPCRTSDEVVVSSFPDEPGDPRNYPVSHTYTTPSSFNLQVCAYTLGDAVPYVINIAVNAQLPTTLRTVMSGFKLVGSSMFGETDNVLYFIESSSPQYLIPILINWDNKIDIAEKLSQPPLVLSV
jgi:hypothetical protein